MASPPTRSRDELSRARLAGPDEGISAEELSLAARNHAMPMEAMRWDLTPVGAALRAGALRHPRARPGGLAAAGRRAWTGRPPPCRWPTWRRCRAGPSPSRWSAPATGARCWSRGRSASRGCPAPSGRRSGRGCGWPTCWRPPGCGPTAVDVVFTGADHGVERGVEQDYARGLPVAEALRPDVLRGHRDERRAAAAAARLPGPARGARLVRHGARQVADRRSRSSTTSSTASSTRPTGCARSPTTRAMPVTRIAAAGAAGARRASPTS